MTTLTPTPKQQFLDANGNPLAGGKVYSYAAGTTTPLATYTDQGGSAPNTNPVILDSRGEAAIWLGVASYKLKLTTATDVEIWTVDSIPGAVIATQKGTTANRPVLSSTNYGVMYFDTTLDVDGKPIWWNGVAWVDATGAIV